MQGKTKPIDVKEINKIEMKNDGHESERFESMLRKVINVPRSEILRREAAEKKAKEKKS